MLLNITDFMIILKTLSTNTVNRLMVICYFVVSADVFVFCLLLLSLLSLVMCLWGCLDVVTLTFEIHFRHKEFRPGRLSGFCRYIKKLWRGKSILYLNGNFLFCNFLYSLWQRWGWIDRCDKAGGGVSVGIWHIDRLLLILIISAAPGTTTFE